MGKVQLRYKELLVVSEEPGLLEILTLLANHAYLI